MATQDELGEHFTRESDALRRVARGILLEPALAEDAVQETWLAALRSQKAASGGWLVEAVKRIAHGLRRSEARVKAREHVAARAEAAPSTAETAARLDVIRQLVETLEALEEPYRTAVRLRFLDGLEPRGVARRMNVPVETARTQIRRGLERMRARLDAENERRREEFLAALVPLALFPTGYAGLAAGAAKLAKGLGGALVSTNVKVVVVAAVAVLVGVLRYQPWKSAAPTPAAPHEASAAMPEPANATDDVVEREPEHAAKVESAGTTRAAVPSTAPASGAWVASGQAWLGSERPFAGAAVGVKVVGGYEGDGERLFDAVVTTDAEGRFSVACARPEGAVCVGLRGATSDYLSFDNTTRVATGADAPQDLSIRLYPLDVPVVGRVEDGAGHPIPDATLRIYGDPVRSDADGRFALRATSRLEKCYLAAWAPGFAVETVVIQVGRGGPVRDVLVRLAPSAIARGRVIDEDGQAVPGAKVSSFATDRAGTTTDAEGRFELDHLPAHEDWLTLTVEADGFPKLQHELEDGRVPTEEIVLVLASGVDVSGHVVDEAGRPLAAVTVYSGSSSYDWSHVEAISHDDGGFVLRNVSRDETHIGAGYDGFAPCTRAIEVPAQGVFSGAVELVLRRGLSVRGRVEDEAGLPIAKANVYVRVDREYVLGTDTRTGDSGEFTIESVPLQGQVELEIEAPGYVRETARWNGGSDFRTYVLTRGAGIAGRVVDAVTGQPVRSFRVRLVEPALAPGETRLTGYSSAWHEEGVLFDDEGGEWSTGRETLDSSAVVGVEIRAEGYGPAVVEHVVPRVDPRPEDLVVALGPGATLTGRVIDAATGAPVVGATIMRASERDTDSYRRTRLSEALSSQTDELGRFTLGSLPREPMRVLVEAQGFAPAIDGPFEIPANSDPAPRTIALEVGATLFGTLYEADGGVLAGETVYVGELGVSGALARRWTLETDERGRFRLAGLARGPYQVAHALPYDWGTAYDLNVTVEVGVGTEVEVELRPSGSGALSGSLSAPVDLPSEAPVTLRLRGRDDWRAVIARDGRFEVRGLEPGTWHLTVSVFDPDTRKRFEGSATVEVSAERQAAVTIEVSEVVR